MNFEKPKNFEKNNDFEVMKVPDIVIREERGAQLFSILLKAQDPNWGETKTELSRRVGDYFSENTLDQKIIEGIKSLQNQGVDEETLYNIALTYQHPEREGSLMELVKKHKPHVKNPEVVHKRVIEIINKFDRLFSGSDLDKEISDKIKLDKEERLRRIDETKNRIERLIIFFKPDPKTSQIDRVNFVPTNPLHRKNSGRAFRAFPGEQIIISHIDNVDNQDHEFLHGIVNPIVDKMMSKFSSEQRQKILNISQGFLKLDYGDSIYSLLCESFIRVYNDIIKNDEELVSGYEKFSKKIKEGGEEFFNRNKTENKRFYTALEEMGIDDFQEFQMRKKEFFDMFVKNKLGEVIYDFYKKYQRQLEKEGLNFEQFVLQNFSQKI